MQHYPRAGLYRTAGAATAGAGVGNYYTAVGYAVKQKRERLGGAVRHRSVTACLVSAEVFIAQILLYSMLLALAV